MVDPKIVLLTGERQIGKSTLCSHLFAAMRQADLQVSGLITERVGPHDLKVVELATNKTYPLTSDFDNPQEGFAFKNFRLDSKALIRSVQAIKKSFPTQAFILDEIGPLELQQKQGWFPVIDLLRRETYQVAFVVVRPELLISAICQLPASFYMVVRVTLENRDQLAQSLRSVAVKMCEEKHIP